MTSARRNDPLPVFCFKVQLDLDGGGGEAFFRSVSGLRSETEVVAVSEGGVNDTTFSLRGATKWPALVLKQGFTASSRLLEWREQWLFGASRARVNGTIIQLDTALQPRAQWKFVRGWPAKWELSELDASKSELAIETLEIVHDGLQYSLPRAGAPPSPERQREAMQLFREENGPRRRERDDLADDLE